MDSFNETIHQPLRLKIMAALSALHHGQGLEFVHLRKLTGASDGNLGAHIETLGKAGYVKVEKAFVAKRPQTTVKATSAGRAALAGHIAALNIIFESAMSVKTNADPRQKIDVSSRTVRS